MRKSYIFLTLSVILLFFFVFLEPILVVISLIVDLAKPIESYIGWVFTLISLVAFIKLRFWDTRIMNKMQAVYGRQKFIESQEIILNLLDFLTPEEIISKVLSIDNMYIEMGKAMKELRQYISQGDSKKQSPPLQLSREAEKSLKNQISNLLKMIDKKVEIYYLAKQNEVFDKPAEKIATTIRNWKKKASNIKKADEKLMEKGKEKLLQKSDTA